MSYLQKVMFAITMCGSLMLTSMASADIGGACGPQYDYWTITIIPQNGPIEIVIVETFMGCGGSCPVDEYCQGDSPSNCNCYDGMIA